MARKKNGRSAVQLSGAANPAEVEQQETEVEEQAAPRRGRPRGSSNPDRPTEIPKFKDETGAFFKLKGTDFPSSKEGKLAYCDYMIEKWKDKRQAVMDKDDPTKKNLRKIKDMESKIKEMKAKLLAEGIGPELLKL